MATLKQGQPGPFPSYSAQNTNQGIRSRPAGISSESDQILAQTWSGDPKDVDPASGIDGMPPNFGAHVLPHVISFQGIISSVSRIYRPSDEAIKDSFENARFMRNDIAVMECIETRQRSVALLDWHIEPDDETDAEQVAVCDELKAILEAIPRFMQYRENLLHATWYGRYGIQQEFNWKRVRDKMRLAVTRWLPVNGDKLVFRYDDGTREHNPDQVGIRVGAGFTTGNSVAKEWTVERINKVEPTDYGLAYFLEVWERPLLAIHKHYIEDGEYEEPSNAGRMHGLGIRSRIYWSWYQKQETLAMLMEYLERSATGMEIWYYPLGDPSAEEKTRKAAQERIGGGGSRNIILVPRPMGEEGMAYGVERIEPGMAGADAMKSIVMEYFGHLIKRYILGQTLTTESDATGLGSGLAQVHLDTFMSIVRYDATLLEETITTDLLRPLLKFNWPHLANVPIWFRIDTEAPDAESKLEAWSKAFEMGLKIPAQAIMDLIGSPKADQDEEVLSLEASQKAAQPPPEPGGMPGMEGDPTAAPQEIPPAAAGVEEDNGKAEEVYAAVNGSPNLNGTPSENSERKRLSKYRRGFDRPRHITAYERGETLDKRHRYSLRPAWREIFKSEIDHDANPLSQYARSGDHEAFCEFYRLWQTNPVLASARFPEATRFVRGLRA